MRLASGRPPGGGFASSRPGSVRRCWEQAASLRNVREGVIERIVNGQHPTVRRRTQLEVVDSIVARSANALARALRVPENRITAILNRQRGITAETVLRLGRYFGTNAQMWMNLAPIFGTRAASAFGVLHEHGVLDEGENVAMSCVLRALRQLRVFLSS
jgi:addiction module HigA family antidote